MIIMKGIPVHPAPLSLSSKVLSMFLTLECQILILYPIFLLQIILILNFVSILLTFFIIVLSDVYTMQSNYLILSLTP